LILAIILKLSSGKLFRLDLYCLPLLSLYNMFKVLDPHTPLLNRHYRCAQYL
jgi:hypothetical protein